MDENFILNENYTVSPMSDQHSTATISEKVVDVSNIGTFVMGEHNSSMITFQIDRYYDGVDLSDKKIKIVYKNSNGIYKSDDAEICNVKYSQKSLRFSWVVSNNVTQTTKFIAYICFISEDYLLKTENFTVQVKSSFDPSTSEPSANWFVTIEGKLEKIEKDIANNHVYDWAKQPEKPTYTHDEVGALSSSTHIPSTLEEMTDDQNHRTVSDTEKETWNNKSEFSGEYSDLKNIPEIKQLTDELKAKYDAASDIAAKNKSDITTKLNKSGYTAHQWLQTDENGNIVAGEKPTYTPSEVSALPDTTHIPSTLAEMTEDDKHKIITSAEREKWNAKSDFSGSYNDLTDVPEIKQLTDDLKEKYDNAATLATANKNTLDTDYAQTKEFLDGLKKGYIEYQLTWVENERITSENGEIQAADGWKRTAYTDICDAEYIFMLDNEYLNDEIQFCGAWYDENHKYIEEFNIMTFWIPPATAKYFILSCNQLLVKLMIGRRVGIQEGFEATASGVFSHAEGISTKASGNFSHAEGGVSTASNEYAHAEGFLTKAIGYAVHAEGSKSIADGIFSHAEGNNTTATGNQSHAEGNGTTASGECAHAEGDGATASGNYSHAEGINTLSKGESSHAEGSNTEAKGKYSHASGFCTQATHSCQYAVGCGNDPQADSLFEVGNGLNAEGNLIDDTTTVFDLKTRRNAFRVTNTGYAIAQTALQIGETAITEGQLKQLIQLITNAG